MPNGASAGDIQWPTPKAIAVDPLGPGSFSCPPGQTVTLQTITYSNVVLTDTTNGVTYELPGTFSRTF
jgi:hypothetical protein